MTFFFDTWFLDSSEQEGSKSTLIDKSIVDEFKQKYEEFRKLSTITEKLSFYDSNKHLFEFPFNQFTIRDYLNTQFSFDFRPAPHFLETIVYNPWFIERSKEHLRYKSYIGLPFFSCEQLWDQFLETKDGLPILKKFIKHEKKHYKALCEENAPGRFDFYYRSKVVNAKTLSPRHELTKDYWVELFVIELVDYIIKLEKFGNKSGSELVKNYNDLNSDKATEEQNRLLQESIGIKTKPTSSEPEKRSRKSKLVSISFLQLFHGNKQNVYDFHKILKKHGYINAEGKWSKENFSPGQIKPIIDYLEDQGIIKHIKSKDQLGEIFNKEFQFIMSARNYGIVSKTFTLDPNLKSDIDLLET